MRDGDVLRFDAAASESSAATQRGRAQFSQRSQSESNARAWPRIGAVVCHGAVRFAARCSSLLVMCWEGELRGRGVERGGRRYCRNKARRAVNVLRK